MFCSDILWSNDSLLHKFAFQSQLKITYLKIHAVLFFHSRMRMFPSQWRCLTPFCDPNPVLLSARFQTSPLTSTQSTFECSLRTCYSRMVCVVEYCWWLWQQTTCGLSKDGQSQMPVSCDDDSCFLSWAATIFSQHFYSSFYSFHFHDVIPVMDIPYRCEKHFHFCLLPAFLFILISTSANILSLSMFVIYPWPSLQNCGYQSVRYGQKLWHSIIYSFECL